ncbi:MAG TPA: carbonic anhydrase [Thermoanaerobaculia bacterium]|nr:carbonic anhydrase [Thermoanaerobaculia bacterium]
MRKWIVAAALSLVVVAAQAQSVDTLWRDLTEGNGRFVEGRLDYCALQHLRSATAGGQSPPTSILSCADSRVPAELVFDRSIGELFVVRVAGNVEDTFGTASLEYASYIQGWTKMIVVMGHSDCGAVKSSLKEPAEGKPTPALYELIMRIRKSFKTEPRDLREATIMNINYTAEQLALNPRFKGVPIIKAYYDVATGKVERIP